MSDRLPYEEQLPLQLNDLPLPDENMAWDDMKRRLEKDDDDGIIPIWLRGCGLWGLLAVVLLGLGWWLVRPDKWGNKKQETESATTIDQKESTGNIKNKVKADDSIQVIKSAGREKQTDSIKDNSKNSPTDSSLTSLHTGQKKTLLKKKEDLSVEVINAQSKKKETGSKQQTVKKNNEKNKTTNTKKGQKQTRDEQVDISIQPGIKNKVNGKEPGETNDKPVVIIISDSLSVTKDNSNNVDSVHKILPDSIQKKTQEQIVKTNEPKKDSTKPKTTSFSAGIAMHQLIPVAGQKLTPYNSLGRKGSLADYIPSVYGRMYRNDKWFLQLEFRYGAPQYTREILYQQKGVPDPFGSTITSTKLKKTFYHQLPVTFNYFVLPNWSLGGGFAWNKFNSAVSEQSVIRHTNATGTDSALGQPTILRSGKADTNFAKSYFQAVMETQYRWKRFSLGARYSFGLQPYLKFTLPGGTQQNEKNKSLQIFLRYQLWKPKKK